MTRVRQTLFLFAFFIFSISLWAQEQRNQDYIIQHAALAVQEMELYKIPASITLSQGILETGGGQSRLAEQANNHFGIKCKKEWKGEKIYHDDDAAGECFRKYPSVVDSYRDHSKFLAERPYYRNCFKLKITDYKGWARCLKKSGYATNPKYAQILINRIERYKLYEFDTIESQQVSSKLAQMFGDRATPKVIAIAKTEPSIAPVQETKQKKEIKKEPVNKKIEIEQREPNPLQRIKTHAVKRKYVVMRANETLERISLLYDLPLSKLKKYNDVSATNQPKLGQNVFLEKKKNKGAKKQYKVLAGDNLYAIAQKTGIRLKKLARLNRININQELKEGQILNLRKRKKRK